jgi:hypothetical protein
LIPSEYLVKTAIQNIEGQITLTDKNHQRFKRQGENYEQICRD